MSKSSSNARGTPLVVTRIDPASVRRRRGIVLLLWLVSLALMYVACRLWLIPGVGPLQSQLRELRLAHQQLLEQQGAMQEQLSVQTSAREVAERALEDLRQALTQRQDEVASLRADVSFYQRLIESGAQQAGLWVHQFRLRRDGDSGNMYRYRLTLAQNLKRGRNAEGSVEIKLTGSSDGKLVKLDLAELTGAEAAPDTAYAFKYFQQLEGTILLPTAFEPSAIEIAMRPKDGASTVRREFTWAEANQEDDES